MGAVSALSALSALRALRALRALNASNALDALQALQAFRCEVHEVVSMSRCDVDVSSLRGQCRSDVKAVIEIAGCSGSAHVGGGVA